MVGVRLTGWIEGFQKVAMSKALMQHAGLSLSQAKHVVDQVLDGHSVTVELTDAHDAHRLIELARTLGAVAVLEGTDPKS